MRQASSSIAVITVVIAIASLSMLVGSSVASLVHTPARFAVASTFDFPDNPVSVAVDAAGDIIVGLSTDVASGVVRRFSSEGLLRSATPWSGALTRRPFVAEGPPGTAFVGQIEADEVAVVDAAGAVGTRWTVPFPIKLLERRGGIIASGPMALTETFGVFALAEMGEGRRVVQFGLDGREIATWPVDARAYDLAVGRGTEGDPGVFVVVPGDISGTSRVVIYRLDGTVEDDQAVDGTIVGYDTTIAGEPRQIVRPHLSPTAHLDARNGPVIAGDPSDLAVAPNGDLFVVSHFDTGQPGVVLHYSAAGCLISTWSNELLNGFRSAVPTPGPSPCPGQDATATPTAGEPPVTTPSPSPTPTSGEPSTTTPSPSRSPTQTRTPVIIDLTHLFVPIARRDTVLRP